MFMAIGTKAISKSLLKRPLQIIQIIAEQILVRAVAWSPIWVAFIFPKLSNTIPYYSVKTGFIIVLLLYIILVFPARNRAALQLTKLVRRGGAENLHNSNWGQLILAGLIRSLSGILWFIPCILLIFRLYQYIFIFEGTRFSRDFISIGSYFLIEAQDVQCFNLGMTIYFSAVAITLLIASFGWHWGVPYDFQMVGLTTAVKGLHIARKVRRICYGKLICAGFFHALLLLPAIIIPIIPPYLKLRSMLTGNPMQDLQLLYVFLTAGMLSNDTILLSFALFCVLYFPVVIFRKAQNADIVVNCYVHEN
jgi:hypothetical protein